MFNLKENSIRRKTAEMIKKLSQRQISVSPISRVAILNNPQSNLTFENLKYVQKALKLSSSQFDIFTFKEKNDHYNELRGIVTDKDVFSLSGKIKAPEILEFLDKSYDLLLDFTGMTNLYEKYLSLSIKANFRVGYFNEEELYDLMIEVAKGKIKPFVDETVRCLKILGLLKSDNGR